MKLSNHIAVLVLTLLSSVFVDAQDIKTMLGQVHAEAKGAFVALEYAAEISGSDGEVKDSGVIEAQDDMWHLKGSLLEIYTDASGTWILDSSAKEAYVEPAWTYDDLRQCPEPTWYGLVRHMQWRMRPRLGCRHFLQWRYYHVRRNSLVPRLLLW